MLSRSFHITIFTSKGKQQTCTRAFLTAFRTSPRENIAPEPDLQSGVLEGACRQKAAAVLHDCYARSYGPLLRIAI